MKSIGNRTWEAPYGLSVVLADAEGIELVDPSGYAETNPTFQSAVRASRVGTFAGQPSDGDTVTIARIDGSTAVYRFKNTMAQRNDVKIGANQDATLTSLGLAISGGGVVDTDYYAGTESCLDYEVAVDTGANTITLTAINSGEAYNTALNTTTTESAANFSWAAGTAGVNSADWLQYHNNSGTAIAAADNVEAYPVMRGGEAKFCPTAAQLTAKRFLGVLQDNSVNAGGDDTASSVFLRRQLTVVTTLHPAAGDPKGVIYCGVLDDPTDLASSGLTVEIPNLSHADDGDWLGGEYSVPDVDDIVANKIIELFNPYTGVTAFGEIKSYDYTDAGFGTNQGRITFAVGGGIDTTIAGTLRLGSAVYYRVYDANIGRVAELAAQAKADVNAEADTALSDYGPLKPTTAGRTLDVSAGGEAGVDWANVGSPTTTVGLSGTTVKTATDVETDTQDIQGRLPAALVSGRIDSSVGAMAANVMTAAAAAADLTTELQSGLATAASLSSLDTKIGTPSNLGGGATVAANLSDIEAQTDDIGTAGAGLTAIPDSAGVTTLLSRIPSALFSGITSLAQWLGLLAGKQVGNSTARTELRATGAGSGTYDETTDSLEAERDNIGTAGAGLSALAQASVVTEARLAELDAANLPADVDQIKGDTTTDIPATLVTIGAYIDTEVAAILAAVDTEIAAIKAVTDAVGATGSGLSAVPWNAAWDAEVQSEVDDAITAAFGIVTGSVNDAAATVNGFTVTDTVGADIRLGTLRLTSGALAGESRLVTWTGTTVAVVKPTSVPAGLTTIGPFSAAVANGVTYSFRPL